jgi:hypothetical protein
MEKKVSSAYRGANADATSNSTSALGAVIPHAVILNFEERSQRSKRSSGRGSEILPKRSKGEHELYLMKSIINAFAIADKNVHEAWLRQLRSTPVGAVEQAQSYSGIRIAVVPQCNRSNQSMHLHCALNCTLTLCRLQLILYCHYYHWCSYSIVVCSQRS